MPDEVRRRRWRRASGVPSPRRWTYRALIGTGVVLIVAVVAWEVYVTEWMTHSDRVGQALVHQFLKNRALASPVASGPSAQSASTASIASCGTTPDANAAQGILVIPELGVTAPVEQGTGDAQLDVSVGHDPDSVWPGAAGNAVLEAHDVSYFVNLAQLVAGDTLQYETPCTTYVFQVQSHSVVAEGAPVYNTPGPTMTLVTCWPTDALWYTPDRYLVTATEVSSASSSGTTLQYETPSPAPTVPVPAALLAQGVTLATYPVPMGTMALAGSPGGAWAQTTGPLLVQDSAVEAFIAGVKSLTQSELGWWGALAPHVAPPAPLTGAHNPSYETPLNVTVTAAGTVPTSVTLTTTVQVTGGMAPGRYGVSVAESVHDGTLVISSWTMEPA
jgi:sortase A